MPILNSLLAVGIVSLISLIGIFSLSIKKKFLKKIIPSLVALSVGSFLGDSFFHILPEAIESKNDFVWLMVIAGILAFFILEKIIHWHHCHNTNECEQTHQHQIKPLGKMNLIGDGFHNFLDGLAIGSSFLISPALGIATTLAVIIHEIPQEISDFGVLIYSGYSTRKAIFFNFLSALFAFLGIAVIFIFGKFSEDISLLILPFIAGSFIYIAMSDIIPELKEKRDIKNSLIQLLFIIIGLLVMLFLKRLG